MSLPLMLIPLVVLGGGIAFMLYSMNRYKSAAGNIDLSQERKNYEQYKQELLAGEFAYLRKWANEKPIDAFTTAAVHLTKNEKIKAFLVFGLKAVLLKALRIKLVQVSVRAFWVLSGDELIFLQSDKEGNLRERLSFSRERIEAAHVAYIGAVKEVGIYTQSSEETLPKAYAITFDHGASGSFEIHDRLAFHRDEQALFDMKQWTAVRAKYQVVGEGMIDLLKQRYASKF